MASKMGKSAQSFCVFCESHLVDPVEGYVVGDNLWNVEFYCPECYKRYEITLDKEQVDLLISDVKLIRAGIEESLQKHDFGIFGDQIELFVAALWKDQIEPMDF